MSIVLVGSTSGSCTLQEQAVAGTTVLTLPTTSGTVLTSASSVTRSQLPTGSVLQVLQAAKTDTFSMTGQTWTDITGLSVSITPTSSSSKILVFYNLATSYNTSGYSGGVRLVRNSTAIHIGDAAGSRNQASNWGQLQYTWEVENMSNSFLDSPATTSSTTYKVQLISGYSGQTVYIGRSYNDYDGADQARTASSITVMEIAA